MEFFGMGAVASISIVAYLAKIAVKSIPSIPTAYTSLICGFVGGLFGLLAYYNHMDNFPVSDPITAFAVGIVSGLAALSLDLSTLKKTSKLLDSAVIAPVLSEIEGESATVREEESSPSSIRLEQLETLQELEKLKELQELQKLQEELQDSKE